MIKQHVNGLFIGAVILLMLAAWMPQAIAKKVKKTGPGGAAQFSGETTKVSQAKVSDLATAIAESSGYRGNVLKAAARHKGSPYLYRKGKYLFIGNDRLAAVFRAANNEFVGLVDIYNGGNMLAYGNGPLWKMTLADSAKKPAGFSAWEGTKGLVKINSWQAGSSQYKISKNKQGVALTLIWNKLSVAGENNVLSAQATVSVDAGSPYLRWNITVNNRSIKHGVWQLDFPRLESIMPAGEPTQTGLFLPWGQGRVVKNPFTLDKRFMGQYPAPSAPMQYSAIYGLTGGLFLATHDGKMFMKQFVHECQKNPGIITYYLRNLPPSRGNAGVNYRMPYDFVMTSFKGNWFDAARIYRKWAIKQIWCSGGPLATRKDVPEWYKKLTFWSLAWEQKSYSNWDKIFPGFPKYGLKNDDDLTLDDIKKIATTMKVPYAIQFYGWHKNNFDERFGEYFPPLIGKNKFRKQVRQMQDAGAKVIPYLNGSLWDKSLDSYKKKNIFKYCIKDAIGSSYSWRIDHTSIYKAGKTDKPIFYLDWPCPYTKFWQMELAKISRKLVADYGVDGIYYDVLSGNGHMCFDPNHGHTTGGGNYWAMGNREVLRQSRQAIRSASSKAIMLSEQPSEAYIDMLDGFLLYHVQAMPGTVPAFQAVYHEYCLLFGNYTGTQAAVDHLPMFAGESFVHGDQLGVFNVWPMFTPNHPRKGLAIYWKDAKKRKKNVDFLVHIARMKHNSGYKFLTLGKMMKPLVFNNATILKAKQQPYKNEPRQIPAIINAVWKAPDGTLGLVFCNASESEKYADYTINVTEYGLPSNSNYIVRELHENGASRVVGRYSKSVFSRKERITARRGIILEIQAEDKSQMKQHKSSHDNSSSIIKSKM